MFYQSMPYLLLANEAAELRATCSLSRPANRLYAERIAVAFPWTKVIHAAHRPAKHRRDFKQLAEQLSH